MSKNRYSSKTPSLLISAGTGWSATTPLMGTLTIANEYCHPGYWKESEYLSSIDGPPHQEFLEKYKREVSRAKDAPVGNHKELIDWNKRRIVSVHSPFIKLTKEEKINWMSPPFTIQKYCHFYRNHWLELQNSSNYKAVADFSNINFSLPEEKIKKIKPFLDEWFDTKVIMVFRDPVRRIFSEYQSRYYVQHFGRVYPNAMSYLTADLDKGTCSESPTGNSGAEYIQHYRKWKKYFPIHAVVMEEFWDGNTKPLSNFLDYEIKDLHPNCYWPEMGVNAPHIPGLRDQWSSDHEEMTPQFYAKTKKKLQSAYDEWIDEFGSLPETWGKHIYL